MSTAQARSRQQSWLLLQGLLLVLALLLVGFIDSPANASLTDQEAACR